MYYMNKTYMMCYIGMFLLLFGCKKPTKTAKESSIYQDEYVTAYPAPVALARVDLLIVPKQPIPTLQDVAEQHIPTFGRMLTVAKELAERNNCTIGYRLLIQDRDQTVDRLYMRLKTNLSGRIDPSQKIPEDTRFMNVINQKAQGDIIFRNDSVTAFTSCSEDRPRNGQLRKLIVPNKLIPTVNDVQPEDEDMLGRMFIAAKEIAEKEGILKNYELYINCNRCGQVVYHLHVHLNSKGKV